jgi:hypothetical protein
VEGAQADVVLAALAQLDELRDHVNYIRRAPDIIYY